MSKQIHLQRIKQNLKECYLDALNYGYIDLADKLDEAGHELNKIERKDVMKQLSATLRECYYKASDTGLDRIASAIGIAEQVITDEGLEIGEEYY